LIRKEIARKTRGREEIKPRDEEKAKRHHQNRRVGGGPLQASLAKDRTGKEPRLKDHIRPAFEGKNGTPTLQA